MFSTTLSQITAEAVVPEQLIQYVRAISGRKAVLCQGYAAYLHGDEAVLVAYPLTAHAKAWREQALLWDAYLDARGEAPNPLPPEPDRPSLANALAELGRECPKVTVLAPFLPREAPEHCHVARDCYWQLPLPAPAPSRKLRNTLARAARDVRLSAESWNDEHEALVRHYLQTRSLSPGTRSLYSALSRYAAEATPEGGAVLLLSARKEDGNLVAFSLGDFSGLHTAFSLFSFRHDAAPPGTADLLLSGLIRHAEARGHTRMNLGLGINAGIVFFIKKWGAVPFLPYVESAWDLSLYPPDKEERGLLAALLSFWRK